MAFESIPPVLSAEHLIQKLLRQQGKTYSQKHTKSTSRNAQKRALEATRQSIMTSADALVGQIDGMLASFPSYRDLSPLYQKLIALVLDYDSWKRNLGALVWLKQRIRALQREYNRLVVHAETIPEVKKHVKAYLGRIASICKQINPQLKQLEEQRRVLRKLPTIKAKELTVVIYGFPNVGKTTLLSRLTGADPEIAPYPFTTKDINLGYTTVDKRRVQYVDTPGTLARPEKQNVFERMAEIVLAHAADAVIYVVDPTESTPKAEQVRLFEKLPGLPRFTYISKQDLVPKKLILEWQSLFAPAGGLEGLREFILKIDKDIVK